MAKYKVGDKVRVRTDLNQDTVHDYVSEMSALAGSVVTIESINDRGNYHILEDCWVWYDSCFSGLACENSLPELKTGMILELQGGHLMMVFRDTPKAGSEGCCSHAAGPDDWWALDDFDANGVYSDSTIMKIYVPVSRRAFGLPLDKMDKKLIWEREAEPKKMTVAEVQAALGYKVEIVEG